MDLGTIQKRLENEFDHHLKDFVDDVHLTFDNAMVYNPAGTVVHNMAVEVKLKFTKVYDIERLIKNIKIVITFVSQNFHHHTIMKSDQPSHEFTAKPSSVIS
jgi:hypothetical protein